MKILGKEYKVVFLDSISMNGLCGQAIRDMAILKINKSITKEQQEETLIHEVLHIIDSELVLDLTEEDVSRLAVGLYSAGGRIKA